MFFIWLLSMLNLYKTTDMEKLQWKQSVLDAAIDKQQALITDFTQSISDMKKSTKLINEGQFDAQQASYNDEVNERINLLTSQLNFAQEEMDLLNRMEVGQSIHETVRIGSIVETDQRVFFISVSSEELSVAGKDVFGISTKAPIFASMLGKRSGEFFNFNDLLYSIKDVY